jgi:cyclopropane-fatty-acyl-phospholipid synthase
MQRARVADRKDIDFSYSLTDRVVRLSLGDLADFSGAKYDGDFTLTLEQAQRRKHDYIAAQIGIGPDRRILDLGCGWGGLLNSMFGPFDAVASLGAFEHFCSPEDYRAGRQDEVYRRLFANVAGLLPAGGRFYLQTMVFGRNMIPVEEIDRHAPRESDAWYLAMMSAAFPGSFLPFGQDQVVRCAAPEFRLVSSQSGRLDYIETIRQWDKRTERWTPRLALFKLSLLPRWLTDPDFRFAFTSGVSSNSACFERELMDHYRLVFEKI